MNSIKTYVKSLGRGVRTTILALAVVFISAGIAQAATTISTNISTGGTLSVTGLSSLGSASSTQLSANTAYFGQTATSTFGSAGALTLVGALSGTSGSFSTTLGVTGLSSLAFASSTLFSANSAYFGATATSSFTSAGVLTLQNGETITNAVNGEVSIGGASDTVKILGTASTSALKVGDEPAAPTINGMVFGYCSFANVTSFTATTTKYVDCTTTPTGALLTTDRVFVQATSSWDTSFVILAASSTAVSTVQLRVLNLAIEAEDTTLNGTSINFWALR